METELGLAKTELAAIKGMLTDGTAKGEVTLSGNIDKLKGLHSERPAAAAGNKGKTYWSIDTGEVAVSTGTAWRVLGVA
jgi:hypothetical protein